MGDNAKLLAELARAKAAFQQRTIAAILSEGAPCNGQVSLDGSDAPRAAQIQEGRDDG